MHEAKSLSVDLEGEKIDSGYVAAGLREVRNEAESATGSSPTPNTIGIVAVAALAASAAGVLPGVAITATRRRIKPSSKSGNSAY